jgi:hypothetical protein
MTQLQAKDVEIRGKENCIHIGKHENKNLNTKLFYNMIETYIPKHTQLLFTNRFSWPDTRTLHNKSVHASRKSTDLIDDGNFYQNDYWVCTYCDDY